MILRHVEHERPALDTARDVGTIGAVVGAAVCKRDSVDLRRLNATILHALRHAPEAYGLALDEAGWACLDSLIEALRRKRAEWSTLTKHELLTFVIWSGSRRYELRADRVRALYGHSFNQPVVPPLAQPPEVLYHGTQARALENILRDGLKPMGRQYVHLTADIAYAASIKKRNAGRPVMLLVQARAAHENGIQFYQAGGSVWLASAIPAKFISTVTHPKALLARVARRQQQFLGDARRALPIVAATEERRLL